MKAAMQLGQAFPHVDADGLLERAGRKAIESRFGEAVGGRQGMLWGQFVSSIFAVMMSDAATFRVVSSSCCPR
jgi:hypothetical protein